MKSAEKRRIGLMCDTAPMIAPKTRLGAKIPPTPPLLNVKQVAKILVVKILIKIAI